MAKKVRIADAESGIRAIDKKDLEIVLEILNITNKAFYQAIVPADTFREPYLTTEGLAEESERKAFTVYELRGKIVGVAAFAARCFEIGVVDRVYVLSGFQRRGIGGALLAHIERCDGGQGGREIVLWTDPRAAWAIAFYRRLGYSEIEVGAIYNDAMIRERVKQHGRELVVLRKRLSPDRMTDRL